MKLRRNNWSGMDTCNVWGRNTEDGDGMVIGGKEAGQTGYNMDQRDKEDDVREEPQGGGLFR